MLPMLANLAQFAVSGLNLVIAAIPLGIKSIKYFIDSTLRDHVQPMPGSVLYCDLWVAVEHSGIYVGNGKIANIVVDGAATATVERCGPQSFTSKSMLGRKIYVSCNQNGAVGHPWVGHGADAHVGERSLYGLVIKNCHEFSTKCVEYVGHAAPDKSLEDQVWSWVPDLATWEPTLKHLKSTAEAKLGASTWRLWDWDGSIANNPPPEPDWQALADELAHMPLNPESIAQIRAGLAEMQAYEAEIANENIPAAMRQKLRAHTQLMEDIAAKYEEVKDFLAQCPGAGFSYADLQAAGGEDFTALAQALRGNAAIQELARKMGHAYISEQRKKQTRIPQASRSEVHGTHRSDDVMRLLPSELLNLEDEALENLFYARLLEKQLQTYELQGTTLIPGETTEAQRKRTGPVVACLDTSGSMGGTPLLKAKALLLAIANILRQEERSLHVLLFGAADEIREFALEDAQHSAGLLHFLRQGFGGGTNFEAPLARAMQIIEQHPAYEKADVLMISDGDCQLSDHFCQHLHQRKAALDCMVYSVLCDGQRVADGFSDEVAVL